MLRQNRCMAERLVRMPWVLSRWSASSAWVQLARSSPCAAGPSMTQRRISSAMRAGIAGSCPLALRGIKAVEPAVEVGVEPALDGAGGDAQVGGDVLVGPAPVGQPDDLEAVTELAVSGLEEGLFEASGLGVGQLDADHDASMEEVVGLPPLSTNRKASAGLCMRQPRACVARFTHSLLSQCSRSSRESTADLGAW